MSYHEVPLQVTDALVTMIHANLQNIKTGIGALDVTSADLKLMTKMGKRRYTFSKEAFEFAQLYPGILFANRSVASFEKVKTAYDKLSPVFKEFTKVYRTFTVLVTVLGSNTYAHGRSTYEAIMSSQNDAEAGIAYAREVLAAYFKGQGIQEEPTDENGDVFVPGNDGPTDGGPGNGV